MPQHPVPAAVGAAQLEHRIGPYSFDEFMAAASAFHGSPAPGLLIGGFMVDRARSFIPEGTLFDAVSETSWCLPDAIQMLTPCTMGNGWLRIVDLGLYALSFYDKHSGEGVRVALDADRLAEWPAIHTWLLKLKPKREQDSDALRDSIRRAGSSICSVQRVQVAEALLRRRAKGGIGRCPRCAQAFPLAHGEQCRSCQGESPYRSLRPLEPAGEGARA